jgi:IclR family acetate operon transcriptional repressor
LTRRVTGLNITAVEQQFQTDAQPTDRGTTAIDRGAELLVRVLEAEQPVALADLASASGIPKSTASRLVSALERQGLVEQDGERGRLRPGPAILRVAQRSMLERSVVELARPSLDVLGEASGETINLAVPGPLGVEHIAQVEGRHFLGAGQWLGRSVDFHCTANGKLFMAFGRATMPARPLAALTAQTITDPARLRVELAAIRQAGFAEAVDELEIGLAAIAAPVCGARGEVVAALSISGPTIRMSPERIAELKPILIDEARTLSRRLGNPEQGEHAA